MTTLIERMSAPDKRLHLIGGALVVLGAIGLIFLGAYVGIWAVPGAAGIAVGVALERYQAIRHEGESDKWDAIATALPGVLTSIGLLIWMSQ